VSVPVPLDELAAALARRSYAVYLLTVGDDGRAHCVGTTIEWIGDELVAPAGSSSVHNAAARGSAVLLSPPAGGPLSGGGTTATGRRDEAAESLETYTLIVDGDVTGTTKGDGHDGGTSVRLRPTHAVFHRPVVAADGGRAHDCVHVYDGGPPVP
jgi:hypothetical protein